MKFRLVFGFILLILFFVALFVGLPYLFQILKSGPLTEFPRFMFSSSTSTMPAPWNFNYFYQPTSFTRQYQQYQQYQQKVRIGGISGGYGNLQINLQSVSYESPVNITGWRIRSAQRGETLIGKGINLVQFDSVSSDVWLTGGESADIIAGVSPLATNFRINICFGGLSNIYNLGYGFSCPAIAKYDLSGFDSSCQDLILRSNSCQAPSDNILNGQSSKCRIWFEKNVNYGACVNQYRNSRDFYRGWKIYTGNGNQIFDPLHDKIELRDQAGLLIDVREY